MAVQALICLHRYKGWRHVTSTRMKPHHSMAAHTREVTSARVTSRSACRKTSCFASHAWVKTGTQRTIDDLPVSLPAGHVRTMRLYIFCCDLTLARVASLEKTPRK